MMKNIFYIKDLLKIAFPIIMGNIGFIMIGATDVIVAGRHSTDTLAAISLATAITNCIMMLGIGILSSISAILSNYRGKGISINKYFFQSLKFAFILACIISLMIFACIPVVDKLGFATNLVSIIKEYLFITAFTTFGAYLHCSAKEYLQAFEIVIFPNLITIISIFINLFLNIIFVFGYGFIPEMGAVGLAVATLITRYFMGVALLIYCLIKTKLVRYFDKKYYKDLLKVGFPASIAVMIEFVGFNIIGIIMGRVDSIYAAAHMVLCTFANISFMVPLAISNATAVKVGYCNGAKYQKSLKKYAYTGLKLSVIFMFCVAITYALVPKFLLSLFTPDKNLILICIPLMYILAAFQTCDGMQVTLAGIFKGLKRTKIVMISNFISYWLIAFPIGYLLAFKFKLNLFGFWTALLFSSTILCIMMLITMQHKFNKMEK
ncbi:MATE family efflux transporter [bacterium]|nr:MATE family efflux transporter [bacterium]